MGLNYHAGDVFKWVKSEDYGSMWLIKAVSGTRCDIQCVRSSDDGCHPMGFRDDDYYVGHFSDAALWRRVDESKLTAEVKATIMLALMDLLGESN